MKQSGSNFVESLEAWSDITMKVLLQRLDVLGFSLASEHLIDSLKRGRLTLNDKGNKIYNITMSFNLYGRFVDMGVGRGFYKGNSGNVESNRSSKEWLSRYWWAQMHRLKEITRDKFTSEASVAILDELDKISGGAKTQKGFYYAVQQSKRNARNYARRRALPGRWDSKNHKTWKPY